MTYQSITRYEWETNGVPPDPLLTEEELIKSAPPEYINGKPFRDKDGTIRYLEVNHLVASL